MKINFFKKLQNSGWPLIQELPGIDRNHLVTKPFKTVGDDLLENIGRAQVAMQHSLDIGLSTLTKPSSGRVEHYRFLVHAVNPHNPIPGEEFFQKTRLSCSLIDNAHPRTYGAFGFILEAPTRNIQRMLPEAGGTNSDGMIKALGGKIDNSLMTFDELLSKTQDTLYNEIIVTQNGGNKITGVFCKVLPDGTPVSKEAYDKALLLSRQRLCPLVLISEKNAPSKIFIGEYFSEKGNHYLCVQNNGLKYYMELGENVNVDSPFRTITPNKIRKMTREEFEQILPLVEKNIPEN